MAESRSTSTRRATLYLVPGILVFVVVVTGIITSLPPPSITRALAVGVADERNGELVAAVSQYQAVLSYDPSAAYTRGLLACSLWRLGKRSLAAEEAYRAAQQGWIPRLQGACGGDVNLGLAFTAEPFGSTDILLVYNSPQSPALVVAARSPKVPVITRLADAACLGMNADFVSFGVEPVASANRLGVNTNQLIGLLRGCLRDFASCFQCSPASSDGDCVLRYDRELVRRRELRYVGITGG